MDALLSALGWDATPGQILLCALLLAARLGPIAWLAPYVAPMGSPVIVRSATLAALVAALLGLAMQGAQLPSEGAAVIAALARELTIGLTLAVASSVPLVVLEHVGRGLDAWRPSQQDPEGAFTRLFAALAAAAFVAIGGLRLVVHALGAQLVTVPLGEPLAADDTRSLAMSTLRVLATAITMTASLAAPALVALVSAELGIALAVRAARFGRALDAALGLRGALVLAAALLAVAAALPELPALTRWAVERMS